LVTDGISEVREHSIVGNDGVERAIDAIIFGTGFHVSDFPSPAEFEVETDVTLSGSLGW